MSYFTLASIQSIVIDLGLQMSGRRSSGKPKQTSYEKTGLRARLLATTDAPLTAAPGGCKLRLHRYSAACTQSQLQRQNGSPLYWEPKRSRPHPLQEM